MGIATSVQACSERWPLVGEVNCTLDSVPYGQFGSNPSITGIGTDISFVLTAGLSLITCYIVQVLCDRLGHHTYRKLLEPLVVSFGDQQLLRGLSLSIATLFSSSACTIDAYRYNILAYLLMMAIVSHMSSVLVLRSYVQDQVLLSCVRFALVLAQMVFVGYIYSSRVTDTFPTGVPSDGHNTTMILPAVCFEHPNSEPYSAFQDIPHSHGKDAAALTMYIMLFVFYGINLIITLAHIIAYFKYKTLTWEERLKKQEEESNLFRWMSIFRGLILLGANVMFLWALIRMYQLRSWMNGSGWMSPQNLQADNEWNFGQLLSAFMLAAAPMAVLGAWSDFKLERKKDRERRKDEDLLLNIAASSLELAAANMNQEPQDPPYACPSPTPFSPNQNEGSRYTAQPEYNSRRMSGYSSSYSGRERYESHTNPPSYVEEEIEMDEPLLRPPRPLPSVPSYRAN